MKIRAWNGGWKSDEDKNRGWNMGVGEQTRLHRPSVKNGCRNACGLILPVIFILNLRS
jgi:hypothetical protein